MDLPTLANLGRLAISVAIGLAFLGALLVAAALVGTLRTDRPRCRQCGQCLRSFGEVLQRCPGCGVECGSGRSVRFGPRRRHPRVAAVGGLLLLLAGALGVAGHAMGRHVATANQAWARATAARDMAARESRAMLGAWDPSTPLELHSAALLPRRDSSRASLELVLALPLDRRGNGSIGSWGIEIASIQVQCGPGADGASTEPVGVARWRVENAGGQGEVIVLLVDVPAIREGQQVALELQGTFGGGTPLRWRYEQVALVRKDLRTPDAEAESPP